MALTAELLVQVNNILGEGPLWISSNQQLVWTDIMGNCLYSFMPVTGELHHHKFDTYFASIGEASSGGIVAATGRGLLAIGSNYISNELLEGIPYDEKLVRFNDGKIGPDGAFWVGTMDLKAEKPVASLYRLSLGANENSSKIQVTEMENGLTVSNGIGWSPDAKIMYLTDSKESVIYSYDFDIDSGSIFNKKNFVKDSKRPGVPDGLAVDRRGNIWSARWGGGVVVCYDSDGREKDYIKLPVSNVTSCCFGAEKMDILYITTAQYGLGKPVEPDGSLFSCFTGTRGQVQNKFGEKQ